MLKIQPRFLDIVGHNWTYPDKPLKVKNLEDLRTWQNGIYFVSLYRDWQSRLPSRSSIYLLYYGTVRWTAVKTTNPTGVHSFFHFKGWLPEQATSFRRVQYIIYTPELLTEQRRIYPTGMSDTWKGECVPDKAMSRLNVALWPHDRWQKVPLSPKSN